MPATQRGQAYRLGPNRWGLRYYDADGQRRRKCPFPTKSAALAHYRDVDRAGSSAASRADARADARRVRAALPRAPRRRRPAAHDHRPPQAARVRRARVRRRPAPRPRADERARSPRGRPRSPSAPATAIVSALRQTLGAAVRWGHMAREPRACSPGATGSRRRGPSASFSRAELDAIAAELHAGVRAAPDVRRRDRTAARGVAGPRAPRRRPPRGRRSPCAAPSPSGEVVELGKTTAQPPTGAAHPPRALAALDAHPAAARHAARVPRAARRAC